MKQKKSDRTRTAIVDAARSLFREHGYERTTVRDVAAAAAVDPALVIRYFGNKERLFGQVVDIQLALPDLSGIDRAAIGAALTRHFLRIWETDGNTSGLPVLLRSAASNEAAAERLRETFSAQVAPVIQRFNPQPDAGDRATLVSSQLLGVALCRYILRLPPLVALPPDQLVSTVGKTIQRYIFGDL